jgi:hypothetical protein
MVARRALHFLMAADDSGTVRGGLPMVRSLVAGRFVSDRARGGQFACADAGDIGGDGKCGRALPTLAQDEQRHIGHDVDLVRLARGHVMVTDTAAAILANRCRGCHQQQMQR